VEGASSDLRHGLDIWGRVGLGYHTARKVVEVPILQVCVSCTTQNTSKAQHLKHH
jgi:hypothetical protein